jgi:hypothetical protein
MSKLVGIQKTKTSHSTKIVRQPKLFPGLALLFLCLAKQVICVRVR